MSDPGQEAAAAPPDPRTSGRYGARHGPSEIRVVKPSYVYHEVARELERYIAANELQPGDPMPSERELCAQLSASRPSLREALRMLELVGLVETRRGGRTVVGSFDLRLLTEWIGRSIPRSNENMRGLLVVREVLEVRAAELAAERITPEECAELEEILRRTEEKAERGEEVLDEDIAFHEVVFRSCGNAVLQRLSDVISGLLYDLRQDVLAGAGGGAGMLVHHRRVAAALVARDPEQAGEAMGEHIRSVMTLTDELLGQ